MRQYTISVSGTTQSTSPFQMQKPSKLKGSKLEEFTIERVIGQGAYAEVKEAYSHVLKQKVALKIYDKYKLIDPQKKRNLIREIRVLEKINHNNIIQLYDSIDALRQVCYGGEGFYGFLGYFGAGACEREVFEELFEGKAAEAVVGKRNRFSF